MKLKSNYSCSQMLSSYRPRRTPAVVQVMPPGAGTKLTGVGHWHHQGIRSGLPVAEPFMSSPRPGSPYGMGFKQVAPLAPSICIDQAQEHQSSWAFLPISV